MAADDDTEKASAEALQQAHWRVHLSGPRDRAYWQAKLLIVQNEVRIMATSKASPHPKVRKRAFRRYWMLKRKLPFYRERIEALTFDRYALLSGPEFV